MYKRQTSKGGDGQGSGGRGIRGSEGKGERREGQIRVEGLLLWILDTLLLLHDHSDILLLLRSLKNCYHETSINKTVKLHVLLSVVLEIENVNAKTRNF